MSPTDASELLFSPATELAGRVREREVSSRELVEASLARIDALDGRLNAFVRTDGERALATADQVRPGDERPFAGVPLAVKDLTPVDGMALTFGSSLFGEYTPGYDSHVVRRFRAAGFVLVGMTNMPEAGILPVTEPRRYGPTRNPWRTDRTPGGSSGGSAAAVAAGMVPVAHATDGGGSTRIPAACCGLVGLKPARGRISLGPDAGEHFTSVSGCLTRTVADTAAVLDVLAGYELGDATWAPPPPEPFAAAAAREPGRLRIGLALTPPIDAPVDGTCVAAVHDTAGLLVDLGHEVEEIEPPWSVPGLIDLFEISFGAGVAVVVASGGRLAGHEPTADDVEPLSLELFRRAGRVNSIEHLAAVTQLQALSRALIVYLDPYDAVLLPALAERPVPIGEIDGCGADPMATFLRRSARFTPFTAVANISGLPAISLPIAHGSDGLPTGVQLMGRPAGEASLLSLSAQLEAARPWADRRPPAG